MKTENSTGPLPGWTARWRKLFLAVIGTIALSGASCRSPAPMVTTVRSLSDSVQSARQSVLTLLPVPASEVKMALPMDRLAVLPRGAGYSGRSGQATVGVMRGGGDTLIFTSTCDSLARRVIALREELTRIRSETVRAVEEQPPEVLHSPTGWQWFWIRTGQAAAAVLSLSIVYRLLKRRLKTRNS
ncbi:hypothetical protein [Bacteroides uniformis]|uniref:Lipoprotein n=2 Tax=Bacteroides uniformis TaxID=820 RepID=A0A174P842_BACUN|nr:hypothetical protein [Bacteroides uniformis]CUP54918.1 Uncharacterised protein [Bacteroides uniformis]